jgi:hypothetical protein
MRLRVEDAYVAGMWKNSLLDDLGFYDYDRYRLNSRAPTWSWTCLEGRVHFHSFVPLPVLELIDLAYTYDGPSDVGRVSNACKRLKGLIFQAFYVDQVLQTLLQTSHWPLDARTPQGSLRLLGVCHNFAPGCSYTVMLESSVAALHRLTQGRTVSFFSKWYKEFSKGPVP